jgi:purine-cytosine permease-like protein
MSGSMTDSEVIGAPTAKPKRWTAAAGAWLGIGTSPGTLLLGAGIAQRYDGPIPLLSILISFVFMYILLWYPGRLGLNPPIGEGRNLAGISQLYFGPTMQRIIAAMIAIGMIGWFGFNVGLGGAALSALIDAPAWIGQMAIGIPVLLLSLAGLRIWNRLAYVTTIAVLMLVGIITLRLSNGSFPVTTHVENPLYLLVDGAIFFGYISVFSVRAPDFTAGLNRRKDLVISELLLCIPLLLVALAGISLQQGTGSTDLVSILASPEGLPIGNLLIALSVIAPTFTTLYSGAPALGSSTGMREKPAMVLITAIGLGLAILRFDRELISWVSVLAAMLPPLIVPLAVESTQRRRGHPPRLIPIWLWLPGALVSMILSLLKHPLAALAGLFIAGIITVIWLISTKVSGDQQKINA